METETRTHESWCLVQANRITGKSDDLFATSLDHHASVRLTISRATEHRNTDLGYSNYMPNEQLIEVELSPMQWAEVLTSMNVGCGVPCTLRRYEGKRIEGVRHESEHLKVQDDLKKKARQQAAKIGAVISEIETQLAASKLPKKTQEEIVGKLHRFERFVSESFPFMHTMHLKFINVLNWMRCRKRL